MKNETIDALQLVDSRRRGFLSKMLVGGAALVSLPAMSTVVLGDDEDTGAASGKGGKGKGGGRGERGEGARGEGGRGQGGRGEGGRGEGKGTGGGRMDPKALAAEMMANFDKDGDNKLSEAELVAALTAFAQQRAAGRGGADGEARGRGGAAGEGKGKGGNAGGGKGKGKGNQ
ncbi:EF-hand domain-containing protein [Aporhodopirellula aestuarii]|uniref:EF-hand domain-containing protein n=1 Tax=Aporhodopirellula aestuarii TaxID=2950107 RepID=A0ABT0UCY5_9BACT|nr:EF-hand domain-containing protein [Aporhodopirellula aestuarii]MCM2374646.1 EF-hand domain-containing protein [Aporhodopirellula aestuarii]